MLNLNKLILIENALLEVSQLIQLQKTMHPDFVSRTTTWLEKAEKILLANRQTESSKIASIKSQLVSIKRGLHKGETLLSKRKQIEREASLAIRQTVDILYTSIEEERENFNKARQMLNQLMQLAIYVGIDIFKSNHNHEEPIEKLLNIRLSPAVPEEHYKIFGEDNLRDIFTSIGKGAAEVVGLIGKKNTTTLLNEMRGNLNE